MPDESLTVDLEPVGRRAEARPGMTLLQAAQSAGVEVVSLCGGDGWCESCVVRLEQGTLSPPTHAEKEALGDDRLAEGYRLACQAVPLGDVKIDIPPESLTTPQRLQIEGQEIAVALDQVVTPFDLELEAPHLHDLRADTTRLGAALNARGLASHTVAYPVLADLSERLREYGWSVRLALRGDEVVAALPATTALLGLAVDIGTTKLAAYLIDLASGETLARTGAMNPQIGYGEDVISRIAYAAAQEDGRSVLQARLAEALNGLVAEMCSETGTTPDQVVDAVVVGNTAMHHLFAGLPVHQLGLAPYVPAVGDALDVRARDLGLALAPGAAVHLLPNIAGYVGGDHVAMLLATDAWQAQRPTIGLDIGTNTEISLAAGGRLLTCSCASGPAFEGAHIQDGMRAAPGAIERVQIVDGEVHTFVIGNQPPVGICGSGILDVIAELLKVGVINARGALDGDDPRMRLRDGKPEFVLVPAANTGHGRDIVVTRKDVNEIQLAKAAIRTGVEILLAEAGLEAGEIEDFIVAGAFGTYIDIASAIRTGMFPVLPLDRFHQVGNAAGIGAKQCLVSAARRRAAVEIAQRAEYVELSTHPAFRSQFMKAIVF